jgi:hypothetical protein
MWALLLTSNNFLVFRSHDDIGDRTNLISSNQNSCTACSDFLFLDGYDLSTLQILMSCYEVMPISQLRSVQTRASGEFSYYC